MGPDREAAFDAYVGASPNTWTDLQRPLKSYFMECVRETRDPHFVLALNESNIVVGGLNSRNGLHGDVELGTVLDLNGLLALYRWAQTEGIEPFASRPGDFETDKHLASYLNAMCLGTPTAVPGFVANTLFAIAASLTHRVPFNPTWSVLWADIEDVLDDPPERWLEVLGIPKIDVHRWLVVLRYTVREVGTLARPTILDAGWSAYHYPSPPQAPLELGGHPMHLGDVARTIRLSREYVHSQIAFTIAHWQRAGARLVRTSQPVTCELLKQRRLHYDKLLRLYGNPIGQWMAST